MLDLRNEHSLGLFQNGDAIFALATVPGKSAVAVFRCSGPKIWQNLRLNFSRYAALEQAASHSAIYGLLCEADSKADSQANSELIDEVLLLKFCAPRSYTGEDMLEIQCHGSIAVLERIRSLLLELGLREAQRGEFTYRSIRGGKRNLHQAEALALLAESQTQNQRRSVLKNLALTNSLHSQDAQNAQSHQNRQSPHTQKLRELRHEMLEVLAQTELQLDYDETELDFHYALPDSLPLARGALDYLCNSLSAFALQQHHWQPCKVVLAGATNSGKSSLFNRLLASERSIVSRQAGTTRDFLEAPLELAGQALLLFDTAGLRGQQAADPIEREGILRTWQLLEQADFIVLLSDMCIASAEGSSGFEELREYRHKLWQLATSRQIPLLEVWNKCDLLDSGKAFVAGDFRTKIVEDLDKTVEKTDTHYDLFFCSALSGVGLPDFIAALQGLLPNFREAGEAPLNERQAERLREASTLLEEYCSLLDSGQDFDLDWAAELLRQICGRLGEATGQESNAKMLREIFEQFCVGK